MTDKKTSNFLIIVTFLTLSVIPVILPSISFCAQSEVTSALRQYWHWLVSALLLLVLMTVTTLHVIRLNRILRQSRLDLEKSRNGLELKVKERTADLARSNRELQKEIAERKQAEVALRASERKFRAIFDQTFQFIGLLTLDGTLIEANRAALRLIGVEEADVIGRAFWETPWWTHSIEEQGKLRTAIIERCGRRVHPFRDDPSGSRQEPSLLRFFTQAGAG